MGMPLNRQGGRVRVPPGGRARENRKFIQAPSPEIWSETISGGEEVLAQKWGGLFWATSLEKIFGGELRRLHHRQIGGLFTFEDATSIDADQPVHLDAPCVLVPVPRHPRKI